MCGINGIVCFSPEARPLDAAEVIEMRDRMAKRGPDSAGLWLDDQCRVGFGHRRLSIIDLSEAGNQPMSFDNGRYWIVFNGEIYNYEVLRDELVAQGVQFVSHGDTEVLLALYKQHGAAMLPRLRGMFALAIWDAKEKSLFTARDPYGIKPLYYTINNGRFNFASQVKALEHAASSSEVDPTGLVGFLLWGSIPEPYTLRRAIRALPAGHWMLVKDGRISEPTAYYHFGQVPSAEVDLRDAIEDTVRAHLVADVQVGFFLSAGLDASMLTAVARRITDQPPMTLTVGFDALEGTPYDEAPLAAEIARKLGTHHVERRLSQADFPDLWARVISAMDQPSIDGFNTFIISQIAHEAGLKVVISGLGGDELFGSYPSFRDVPAWMRAAQFGGRVPGMRPAWRRIARPLSAKQPKLAGLLDHGATLEGAYFLRRGLFLPEDLPGLLNADVLREAVRGGDLVSGTGTLIDDAARQDSWQAVHLLESGQYMRNQLLRDSDWASMAHSLELRVPLVDVVLREQVAAADFEPARSSGKAAVVKQVAPELPDEVWNRPKSGFIVPIAKWLKESSPANHILRQQHGGRALALAVLDAFELPSEVMHAQQH